MRRSPPVLLLVLGMLVIPISGVVPEGGSDRKIKNVKNVPDHRL